MRLYNVEIEGIDPRDAPDYSDAFISYAEHKNGEPLSDDELDIINSDDIYDYIVSYIY